MISPELETTMHRAFLQAREQRHEFITVEHLLLALLDDPGAATVLQACSANMDDLRWALARFVQHSTPQIAGTADIDIQHSPGLQRVLERAHVQMKSAGQGPRKLTSAHALDAIFDEDPADSHAIRCLQQAGVFTLSLVSTAAVEVSQQVPSDLPARCKAVLARRATGLLADWAAGQSSETMAGEMELRRAEDKTLREALAFVVAHAES
jgi:ATP-dependent Clp protease ATP-binding subunit ClpA